MLIPKRYVIGGAILIALWTGAVIATGLGVSALNKPWNFTNSGAFGDSFGPLGTMMAAIAALSAVATLREQQAELKRLRSRESEQDVRAQKLAFETTFFQLLDHHRGNTTSIDIVVGQVTRQGQDAFKSIAHYLRQRRFSGWESAWHDTFIQYRNDLGHYFRFLYHLFRYIEVERPDDAYFYARIVRATLSESELIILAMNCAHGEGRDNFTSIVESFALLHNLSEDARSEFAINPHFDKSAFSRQDSNLE